MKRPRCIVCNEPAPLIVLFEEGNNNFRGSAFCNEHKANPTDTSNRETLITRIGGVLIPDAACNQQPDGIPAGGIQ
jgi:hypothetical protein